MTINISAKNTDASKPYPELVRTVQEYLLICARWGGAIVWFIAGLAAAVATALAIFLAIMLLIVHLAGTGPNWEAVQEAYYWLGVTVVVNFFAQLSANLFNKALDKRKWWKHIDI